MSCVKTGALIYFENYGYTVVGDVYNIPGIFIFRWNTESIVYERNVGVTYVIDMIVNSENWWHRSDLGVTVAPVHLVTRLA